MSMSKVTETRTQDDLREAITPLNLGNYLHDLEQHAKQTGQLEDLKINYVLNKKSVQLRYELHRLHAIDCIPRGYVSQSQRPLDRISHLHLTPAQIIE